MVGVVAEVETVVEVLEGAAVVIEAGGGLLEVTFII